MSPTYLENLYNELIPTYTIQEADVFNNLEHYEIELEIDNTRIGTGTKTIQVSEIQIEGKTKLPVNQFILGYSQMIGESFEK